MAARFALITNDFENFVWKSIYHHLDIKENVEHLILLTGEELMLMVKGFGRDMTPSGWKGDRGFIKIVKDDLITDFLT